LSYWIDSKLRACDLTALQVRDICHGDRVAAGACVLQCKTQRSVQFEITPPARESVEAWIRTAKLQPGDYLVPSHIHNSTHIGTRQYARILHGYAYNIAEMRAYRGESTQLSIGSNGLTASATLSWSLSKLIRGCAI